MKSVALGIDIGGTNTVFGLIDEAGNSIYEDRLSTKSYNDAEALAEAMHSKIMGFMETNSRCEIVGIGIGAPNGNYYNGTIEYAPNLNWEGIVDLKQIFGSVFQAEVTVTNDANAAAVGEMMYGVAKGMKDFIVVTLGTGLGSGIVTNGQLVHGGHGFAGELGHTIVTYQGRECSCGRKGCVEAYASVTGFVRSGQIILAKSSQPSLLRELNEPLTGLEITKAAQKGDALALEIIDYTAAKLGFTLANVVTFIDPEAIILFGGLANAGDLLIAPTRQYMEKNLLPIFKEKTKLLTSSLQEANAAILGAAALVWKELKEKKINA